MQILCLLCTGQQLVCETSSVPHRWIAEVPGHLPRLVPLPCQASDHPHCRIVLVQRSGQLLVALLQLLAQLMVLQHHGVPLLQGSGWQVDRWLPLCRPISLLSNVAGSRAVMCRYVDCRSAGKRRQRETGPPAGEACVCAHIVEQCQEARDAGGCDRPGLDSLQRHRRGSVQPTKQQPHTYKTERNTLLSLIGMRSSLLSSSPVMGSLPVSCMRTTR